MSRETSPPDAGAPVATATAPTPLRAWVPTRVTHIHHWDADLRTFTLDVPLGDFVPGQFLNLGRETPDGIIKRSYSIASAPGEPTQVFIVKVDGGQFTDPLFGAQVGTAVHVQPRAGGVFTLDNTNHENRVLWLVATGTGLAPYISMLRHGHLWQRWDKVVLVHGARTVSQLAYGDEIAAHQGAVPGRLVYLRFVTRDDDHPAVQAGLVQRGRITQAVDSGLLERLAGEALQPGDAHVMLCGNPALIEEMQGQLEARGLVHHRRRTPGHITLEKYW